MRKGGTDNIVLRMKIIRTVTGSTRVTRTIIQNHHSVLQEVSKKREKLHTVLFRFVFLYLVVPTVSAEFMYRTSKSYFVFHGISRIRSYGDVCFFRRNSVDECTQNSPSAERRTVGNNMNAQRIVLSLDLHHSGQTRETQVDGRYKDKADKKVFNNNFIRLMLFTF